MPDLLRETMDQIREENGGRLTAPAVLAAAEQPGDPYKIAHHFTWDDTEAGHKHRLNEARALIRKVRVVSREATGYDGERRVRAFHSMPVIDPEPGDPLRAYDPVEEIAASPMRMAVLLARMEREYRAFERRWRWMGDYATFIAARADELNGPETETETETEPTPA